MTDFDLDRACDFILDSAEPEDLVQGDRFLDLVEEIVKPVLVSEVLRAFLDTGMDKVVLEALELWSWEQVGDPEGLAD